MTQEYRFYGEVISEAGLGPVSGALTHCSWKICLCISGYDGTHYLKTPRAPGEQREIELEMDSGQSRRFLFGGAIQGTTERAFSLLKDFSQCLTAGGFAHRVELYDDTTEIGYFQHQWPHGQHEPIA